MIAFKLQIFEGPLDLLLHLIKLTKIDICDIFLSDITEQYLEMMKNIGLDVPQVTELAYILNKNNIDIELDVA